MCGKEVIFVLVITIISSSAAANLPDFLKRCSRSSNHGAWNECMKKAIEDGFEKLKKGDPSINVEAYDPLLIDKIITKKSGVLISLDLNQKDTEIRGFGEGIRLDKVDFNFEKKFFSASLIVPKLTLESFQILKGKIVGIPLVWQGRMTCNITRVKCDFSAPFEQEEIDGKEYLKFSQDRIKLRVEVDHVKVRHKESSANDKIIATAADAIINNNWKLVFGVLKPSYEQIFRNQLGKSLVGLFSTVPAENIFLDWN